MSKRRNDIEEIEINNQELIVNETKTEETIVEETIVDETIVEETNTEEITNDTEVEDTLNDEQEIITTQPVVVISDAVVKYVEENPTVGIKSSKSYRVKSSSKGIRIIPWIVKNNSII